MKIENVYASIMTADLKLAHQWYTDFFGRNADYHPMDNLYEWDFKNGGVLQLIEDKKRAGTSTITLMVQDIASIKKELSNRQHAILQESDSEVATTVTIADPELNRITFAQNHQGRS